jgi:signal transduction histidine kinase
MVVGSESRREVLRSTISAPLGRPAVSAERTTPAGHLTKLTAVPWAAMTAQVLSSPEIDRRPAGISWGPALHNLYLTTLLIALFTTVTSVLVPAPRPRTVFWVAVCLVVVAALTVGDLVVRRCTAASGVVIGYFLAAAGVLGTLSAVFPSFAVAAFGVVPLALIVLPWPAAVATGALLTGLPYVTQPYLLAWLFGPRNGVGIAVRFGPAYAIAVGVALPVLTGLYTVAAIRSASRESRERQRVVEELVATREELAAAAHQAGQAEERQRFAHELHDTLAQTLSGMVFQLEAAEEELDRGRERHDPVRLARLIGTARESARQCLADTRHTVEALRPAALDGTSLVDALAEVCARWSETTGLPVNTAIRGSIRRCPLPLEVVALRVSQEALANTAKHAAASTAEVVISYQPDAVVVSVRDDGHGFDPARTPTPGRSASGGFGLITMRERVATLGGTLAIVSTPNTGTSITATLPAPRPSQPPPLT